MVGVITFLIIDAIVNFIVLFSLLVLEFSNHRSFLSLIQQDFSSVAIPILTSKPMVDLLDHTCNSDLVEQKLSHFLFHVQRVIRKTYNVIGIGDF